MSKVLVDRELLERLMRADADMGREGSASFTLDASDRLDRAWAELRAILAKPEDPEGFEIARHSKRLVEQLRSDLSAVTAERDRLLSENARLIEDRARFPDRPDDIGHMIGSHIGNLKAGKVQAEKYARKWRDNLDSEIRAADQLRAEVDALRKDAERYRWLRDPCSGAEHVIYYSRGDYGRGLMSGSMLDAAIDAAMAAKEA